MENPKPSRKPRREVWWRALGTTNHSLKSIGRCFDDRLNWSLLSSSNPLLRHIRSPKDDNLRPNLHQCPGYLREEITLTSDLSKSVIVSHAFPGLSERCSICHQLVQHTYSESFDGKKRRRALMACTNCRERKVKCRPLDSADNAACERCVKERVYCEYRPVKVTKRNLLEYNADPVFHSDVTKQKETEETKTPAERKAAAAALRAPNTASHSRTDLNNACQRLFGINSSMMPRYAFYDESGWQLGLEHWQHDTTSIWTAIVYLDGIEYGRGKGRTKNAAAEAAATQALSALRNQYGNI